MRNQKLRVLPQAYGIARLSADAPIPSWADGEGFVSISRSDDELSILCRQERMPDGVRQDRDWTCLKLLGPFAFDDTGVVLSVIRPLSEKGIGIFVVSTFDGDHLMVKSADLAAARHHHEASGHTVEA